MERERNIFKRVAQSARLLFTGQTPSMPISHNKNTWSNLSSAEQNLVLNALSNKMYDVPEIRTAVNFVAEVFSTIPMYHRRTDAEGNTEYLSSNIDFVLNKMPNTLQTKTTFFVSVITQFLLYGKVVIIPHWTGERDEILESLEPLPHTAWQFYEKNEEYFIVITNGERKKYPIKEVILLSRFDMLNGNGDRQAIGLHQAIMQAIQRRAEKNAINPKIIQAVLQLRQGNMKPEAAKARAEEIAKQITNSAEGELPVIGGDVELKEVRIDPIPVDIELLKYITEVVYNYLKVTTEIIQLKAGELTNELFLTSTIKPIANQFSEAISKVVFTRRELQTGNWIELDLTALQIATLSAKTSFIEIAMRNTVINPNEAREFIGFGRIPGDLGDRYKQTLNIIDASIAAEYQMKMAKGGLIAPQTTNREENNNAGES